MGEIYERYVDKIMRVMGYGEVVGEDKFKGKYYIYILTHHDGWGLKGCDGGVR